MLGQFTDHTKKITGVVIDVSNPFIIHVSAADKTITTYNLKLNKKIYYYSSKDKHFSAITQQTIGEKELVACKPDGTIIILDPDYADPVQVYTDPGKSQLTCVAMSRSGRFLAASGHDCKIKIWDTVRNMMLCEAVCHSRTVRKLVWSPDEKQIISVGEDCSVAVWNNFYE